MTLENVHPVDDQNLMQDGIKFRMWDSFYPRYYVRYLWGKWIIIFLIFLMVCFTGGVYFEQMKDTAHWESVTAEQNRQADSIRAGKWKR